MSSACIECIYPGCGDHGTCTCNGTCVCEDGWEKGGDFHACIVPPPTNVPCKQSDDEFRKAHDGGDKDCGNWGSYGVCSGGTCSCEKTGFYGSRCQNECVTNAHCGGENIGSCNSFGRCECKGVWSGKQCRQALPDATCEVDADCGWNGQQHGTCNRNTQKCECFLDASTGFPLYRGARCEQPVQFKGKPCKGDEDCERGLKCTDENVCYDPRILPPTSGKIAEQFFENFFSEKTAESFAMFNLMEKGFSGSVKMIEWLVNKGLMKFTQNAALKQTEEVLAREVLENLTSKVGGEAAARIMAEQFARDAMRRLVTQTVEKEVSVSAPLAEFLTIVNILGIFGIALDMLDSRGLNQQMMQGIINQLRQQFETSFNENDELRKAGIVLPMAVSATSSVAFQQELASKEVQTQASKDAAEYLSSLNVNSDGELIVPLFTSMAEERENARRVKYSLYWSMARGNVTVFNNLISYGWVMWLMIALTVVSVILTCVFSSPAVQARMRRK